MAHISSSLSQSHTGDIHITLRDSKKILRQATVTVVMITAFVMLVVLVLQQFGQVSPDTLGVTSLIGVAALLICGAASWLARLGRATLAGRIFFYGLAPVVAFASLLFGGAGGPLVMAFLVLILAAGSMGKSLDGIGVGVFTALCYTVTLVAQEMFAFQPIISFDQVNIYMFLLTFLISASTIVVLVRINNHDLAEVAKQSQDRAEELLNKTEQIIEKNIQQVELGSELATAASEMEMASKQQASGATEQATAVSQISTTIEELGSTARQIALAAENVAHAAQQTLENLSTGQDAVDESIQGMERIRNRMQDLSARVLELGERSQQIGEIIDLIDDISDETHLLALNAAIEAAGAGEHGRRFAVVAAEVKSLANRTLAAAKEVKGVIAEIRQATSAAVLAAEEGSKEVERGVDLAHRAGQTMDNIVMVAERTAQSAAEIGLATAQQQSASEQVVETMRDIAEVARQSAAGSRQTAESAARLTDIADKLHGITHQ
jgi:methyl-accepting chemotaxis protein